MKADRMSLSEEKRKPFTRLGKNVLPEHYKLSLRIDTEKCEFTGSAEVTIKVTYP